MHSSFFNQSHSFSNHYSQATHQNLQEIKNAGGIFLKEEQFAQIQRLPEQSIYTLKNNKAKLNDILFYHKECFELLMQLNPTNMEQFFNNTPNMGCAHNPMSSLIEYIRRQSMQCQGPHFGHQQPNSFSITISAPSLPTFGVFGTHQGQHSSSSTNHPSHHSHGFNNGFNRF